MNQHLENIKAIIEQNELLSEADKQSLLKTVADADKEWSITEFKLNRTEKVKKTTAILLEETIAELEQKRKAVEAQNRELEVESSLERVRTVAMSMKQPDDMLEVCRTIANQLVPLGFKEIRNVQTVIIYEQTHEYLNYQYFPAYDRNSIERIDYLLHPDVKEFSDTMLQSAEAYYTKTFEGEALKIWQEYRKQTNQLPDPKLDETASAHYYFYSIGTGALGVTSYAPLSDEQVELFKRFRNVFQLAYKRYTDIEKAQAQAREAQVEASLERVRSRTMAMHKSDELAETAAVVFQQLIDLGIEPNRLYISIINDESGDLEFWITDEDGNKVSRCHVVNINRNISIKQMFEGWAAQKKSITLNMEGEELMAWLTYWNKEFGVPFKKGPEQKRRVQNIAYFSKGFIAIASPEDQPATTIRLLERFAAVFNLTYQRFEDLQAAEALAREAQIETALERVRSRTMGMQSSSELREAASLLFQQIQSLGMSAWSAGYCIWDDNKKGITLWMSSEGVLQPPFYAPVTEDAAFIHMYEAYERGATFYVEEMGGNELVNHYRYMRTLPVVGNILDSIIEAGHPLPTFQIFHLAYFSHGFLLFITYEPVPEAHDIFKRFGKVFEQTYTRFLDLQKAEAQAKEARIEASLERVRSKAMGMHNSQDLADTIGVFYKELHSFSLTPIRCGVGLLDGEERIGELFTWNTTELGGSLQLVGKLKMQGHPVLEKVYEGWLAGKEYHPVLRGNEIKEYYQVLRPQISFPDYEHDAVQYGYFFFFPEGGVYAWTNKEMEEDELTIYRRFTSVLSLTYKRYKDLQQAEELAQQAQLDMIKLKEEKIKTENALAELQITQKQLIQAEKMASLGELTAGIAHEIQNPLNFVNNFSEICNELVEELKENLAAGNQEQVDEITGSIRQNLEKINYHGKRADMIVKGMLQHSRKNTGVKEPTNVNKLVDEYLLLSYHGLRAKDRSFAAIIETHFDPAISTIDVIPQEIGRVLLNLFNNSFYAVNERKKKEDGLYEPVVQVSTHLLKDKVEIKVKDNGMGIPEKVLDKILQPFFTTKPAGQGTGLGLSLSYDIIKVHGGELKFETKETVGSIFTIQLPLK